MTSGAEVDDTILRRYSLIGKQIGKGSYGVVFAAKDNRTGEQVALKKCFDAFRNTTDAKRTYREVTYLQRLGHENIISIKSVGLSSDGKDLYAAFELMEADLSSVIKIPSIFQPSHIKFVIYQTLKALKYLHSAGLVFFT